MTTNSSQKNYFKIINSLVVGGILAHISYAFAAPKIISVSEADIPEIEKAWDAAPNFSETKVLRFRNDQTLQRQIPLTLVIYKNSSWRLDEVMLKLRQAADVIGDQCGINFNPVVVLETKIENGPIVNRNALLDKLPPLNLVGTKALQKPIVYFAEKEVSDVSDGGVSIYYCKTHIEDCQRGLYSVFLYRNLVFAPDKNNSDMTSFLPGKYEVLSHELAHVLLLQRHVSEIGNIMSNDPLFRSNKITKSQCETIYKNYL